MAGISLNDMQSLTIPEEQDDFDRKFINNAIVFERSRDYQNQVNNECMDKPISLAGDDSDRDYNVYREGTPYPDDELILDYSFDVPAPIIIRTEDGIAKISFKNAPPASSGWFKRMNILLARMLNPLIYDRRPKYDLGPMTKDLN